MYPYGTIVDSWTFAGRNFRIHLIEGGHYWVVEGERGVFAIHDHKPNRLWCHAVYYDMF